MGDIKQKIPAELESAVVGGYVTAASQIIDRGNNRNKSQSTINTEVEESLETKAPKNSPAFTGTPKAPTPDTNDSSKRIATTQFVKLLTNAITQALEREISTREADTAAILRAIAEGISTTAAILQPAISDSEPSQTDGATAEAIVNYVSYKIADATAGMVTVRYGD